GLETQSTWVGITEGRSGGDYITAFDAEGFDTRFAAEVKGFDPENYLERKQARRMDRFAQLAAAAAQGGLEILAFDTFVGSTTLVLKRTAELRHSNQQLRDAQNHLIQAAKLDTDPAGAADIGAWLAPLRFAGPALIFTAIAFALLTIVKVLRFQADRITQIVERRRG
ncbi:MAG: hypothetical protein IH818_13790, partial [Acidobacteria bacterium]|nr:hypothetical protein [Acidobacteriota bacterium]